MDFAIKYLSDPVCPAFGPVRSRVYPFSYMLYILLQKDFYYSVFSGICQEIYQNLAFFIKCTFAIRFCCLLHSFFTGYNRSF